MTVIDPPRRAILASVGMLGVSGCLESITGSVSKEQFPSDRDDDWRMYGCDSGRTRFVPDATLPRDEPEVIWEHGVGASGWYPPIVADGTVYCQHPNGLFVIDRDTGEGPNVSTHGGFGRGIGPMALGSTTIYRDGVLVVPYGETVVGYAAGPDSWPRSVDGLGHARARWWADGESVSTEAFQSGFGEPQWLGSPLVVDDAIITLHPVSTTVAASDPNDGQRRWRFDFETAAPVDDGHVDIGGHVVDSTTETVVIVGGYRESNSVLRSPLLAGVDLEEGTLVWSSDRPERQGPTASSDAILAHDGDVYIAELTDEYDELEVLALDAATGDRRWRRTFEHSTHVGLTVDETTVYHVGTSPASGSDPLTIVALDRDEGRVQWEVTLDDPPGSKWSPHTPPPTAADDLLLVPGQSGLHALERTSGDRLWTFTEMVGTSGGSDTERDGLTPAVVSGDRIVFGTTLMLYGLE
ncbi:PQQ-binding-like beta-propeller repeat protein [Natronolimnobius sp. AArcel1]|uniref:PQQ-binding-like beta-propeller repeat protein n=1 Tax=Natronolimnobius sp. AArcel1 TaxID=1679093 RepID=UPI0013EBAB48|nr:PQQ-binding-like beta-propeller repeat protein [Natronolimnobius sp. AArcel1]NGM69952.1 PQQ-binding-like beta-propeller repeat protein [Natronolimnobius sp. AArcel1]